MICPNCQSKMGENDPCPECDHDDGDPDCLCIYCLGGYYIEHDGTNSDCACDDCLDKYEHGNL